MKNTNACSSTILLIVFVSCSVTLLATAGNAQSTSILDTFEDGDLFDDNPVSWISEWGQTTLMDNSLVLSRAGGDGAIAKMQVEPRTNWSIRSQVRLNSGSFIGLGIDDWAWMGAQPNGYLTLGIGDNEWVTLFVPLNPMQEDIMVQFESTDSMIRAWAWSLDSPMPEEPQLQMAAAMRPSLPMVWARDLDHAIFAEGLFRFVQVSTEPIRDIPTQPGDFNTDGLVDAADIDLLSAAVRLGDHRVEFDLNHDSLVDQADRFELVREILNTHFGDSNLDGEFSSTDFVGVFQAGHYEDNVDGNSGWVTGDWDGNGDFRSADIVLAFEEGGYERGPRTTMNAIPESTSSTLFVVGVLGIAILSPARRKGFGFRHDAILKLGPGKVREF